MRDNWSFLSFILIAAVGAYEASPTRGAEMKAVTKLTILQINDSHAYIEPHQEAFAGPNGLVYHEAGGYARIAGLVKEIRREAGGNVFFGDCGDTLFGTYPAAKSQGRRDAADPERHGHRRDDTALGIRLWPKTVP